eukprot:CAMPEP_0177532468 /NCGR_PEP_ID=MMETSP0369-20130122/54676_1 /TAXON_ID=447022 ORGANISM="Scrippsiella hangoei-like, Strain SHHI-4" /NCGR_SAMPLE_ID=MMETSP0369 /ASSEMBLY_ACC=CAM_ASM_000364 /LENGTH=213 /DNA_ID=CAMNT_0019013847 /DNA_START=29 /DNA_END=669 /DNA_ORIENTATION=-
MLLVTTEAGVALVIPIVADLVECADPLTMSSSSPRSALALTEHEESRKVYHNACNIGPNAFVQPHAGSPKSAILQHLGNMPQHTLHVPNGRGAHRRIPNTAAYDGCVQASSRHHPEDHDLQPLQLGTGHQKLWLLLNTRHGFHRHEAHIQDEAAQAAVEQQPQHAVLPASDLQNGKSERLGNQSCEADREEHGEAAVPAKLEAELAIPDTTSR